MSTDITEQKFHLIIAAAGRGSRFGETIPKQYLTLGNKTILRHTLDNALNWPGLGSLHVIINPDDADLYHDAIMGLNLPPPIHGGNERSDSVSNALSSISNVKDNDLILIHDAARPFTPIKDIESILEALQTNRAATLAFPVSDTLRKEKDGNTDNIVQRDGLWAIQTPQAFRYKDIKEAHQQKEQHVTDDTSLVSALGINVTLVEASRMNIKITTADDIEMAEALISKQMETRTGLGFDVHAFETESTDKPLILCGVEIDHEHPLSGHSDADVGLHAITDALLGASGANDIGAHFPPSNDEFKDMNSAVFLQKAVAILKEKGGSVQNIDITLICEAPKIGPYREAMEARIAEILEIDTPRINVKATTTEKLGFTGRGEGIAAQAVATIKIMAS